MIDGAAVRAAEVPVGAFGTRLQATVAVLCGQYHLSQRAVADACGTLLDAPLAASRLAALCRNTAVALEVPVAAVRGTLPTARVVNADETRWPHVGRTAWLWVVASGLATVFTSAASWAVWRPPPFARRSRGSDQRVVHACTHRAVRCERRTHLRVAQGGSRSPGTPTCGADLRIASIALAYGLTLVTGNVRHFNRLPGLTVENWLSATD